LLARFGDFGQIAAQIRPKGGLGEGTAVGNEAGRVRNSNPIVLRRQLPLLGAYVAPRTSTERKLAEIWRNALGMDQIGIADGYEDLGGDSLRAAGIFAEIEQTFAIEIPMATLVDAPTIEQLAPKVDALVLSRVKASA
jgi:acyl carrier protein